MRQHLFGEQCHGLLHHGVVHDPALIEVADELVHSVFPTQRLHPLYAIIRIPKHAHFAVEVLVFHAFDPREDLPERLKALDVCFAEGAEPFRGLAQETKKAGLATWTGKAKAVSPRAPAGRVSR